MKMKRTFEKMNQNEGKRKNIKENHEDEGK